MRREWVGQQAERRKRARRRGLKDECPTGKKRYPSRKTARSALKRIKAERQQQHDPQPECAAYRCSICDGWHLTKQEQR